MAARIIFFLIGLASGGGAGFLGWTNRASFGAIFPADAAHPPWIPIGVVALGAIALACLGWAVAPRTREREAVAAKEAKKTEAIQEAEGYYAEKAAHPADRDWRSSDLPPEPKPQPAPTPKVEPPKAAAPAPQPAPPEPQPVQPAPAKPAPQPQPAAVAPLTMPEIVTAKPTATAVPPSSVSPPPPPATFPGAATLGAIPRGADTPPAPPPRQPAPAPVASANGGGSGALSRIREALAAKKLEEADKLLAEERNRLSSAGDADPLALACLTGLAGDHAAADGRVGGAKWLWRLALQRFSKADAMNTPEARAVAERLRLADQ
jgi:outer membrane biosynthesis protein TonB